MSQLLPKHRSSNRLVQAFFKNLFKGIPTWMQVPAEKQSIILSSRIRLARNLVGYRFPGKADAGELSRVVQDVQEACQGIEMFSGATYLAMEELGKVQRNVLVERRIISPVFADIDHPGMVIVNRDENISIMVNEEDHLRIQCIQPGLGLQKAWRSISRIDDALSEHLDYAFSGQFGYLTACTTNTGTGMRASLLIHLPALALLNRVEKIIEKLAATEVAVRGFYGEGTEPVGHIYQVSNQLTLGRSETAIIKRLESLAAKFSEYEHEARQKLLRDRRMELDDRVYRSLGTLQNARILSSSEFMRHYSMLILGEELELLPRFDSATLRELMIFTQPAHMQSIYEDMDNPKRRDVLRAKIIREKTCKS